MFTINIYSQIKLNYISASLTNIV